MNGQYTLISHKLCPYVQRVAIALTEKKLVFKRTDIDLANKPDWFLEISPLGKTPVLLVDRTPLFESAVICEYLDEVATPRLHPRDALTRARHRGWVEFASALLNAIGAFYSARDAVALADHGQGIQRKLEQLEAQLGHGPFFNGDDFCLVDAAFAPVFRYFDVLDKVTDFDWFRNTPKISAWRVRVAARPSVASAVCPEYNALLLEFLLKRNSELSRRIKDSLVIEV